MSFKNIVLGNEKNIVGKGVFWNMIASFLNAGTSFILVVIVRRILNADDSGIFSYAFSIAQMLLTIGYFDMRAYQVTDIKEPTPFRYYFTFRIMSCTAMMLASLAYVFVGSFNTFEASLIILMTLFKMLDAFEDVIDGLFQKNGRLDVAGKLQTTRIFSTLLIFTVVLYFSKNLVVASFVAVLMGILLVIILNVPFIPMFDRLAIDVDFKILKEMFMACLPLFIGSYLLMYIGQAPRDAIKAYLDNTQQTYYTSLFMPSFVISLLSTFILQPMLVPLADKWKRREFGQFAGMIQKLLLVLAALTVLAVVFAYLLGIPVLSFVFTDDLSPYRSVLLILLTGGGIGAAGTVIYYCATVIRCQKYLIIGHLSSGVAAFVLAPLLVKNYALLGAALSYAAAVSVRLVCFGIIFVVCYQKRKRQP